MRARTVPSLSSEQAFSGSIHGVVRLQLPRASLRDQTNGAGWYPLLWGNQDVDDVRCYQRYTNLPTRRRFCASTYQYRWCVNIDDVRSLTTTNRKLGIVYHSCCVLTHLLKPFIILLERSYARDLYKLKYWWQYWFSKIFILLTCGNVSVILRILPINFPESWSGAETPISQAPYLPKPHPSANWPLVKFSWKPKHPIKFLHSKGIISFLQLANALTTFPIWSSLFGPLSWQSGRVSMQPRRSFNFKDLYVVLLSTKSQHLTGIYIADRQNTHPPYSPCLPC